MGDELDVQVDSSTTDADPDANKEPGKDQDTLPAKSEDEAPWHKDKRFQAFLKEHKEWKRFKGLGVSVDDVANALQQPDPQPRSQGEKDEAAQLAQMREQFFALFPELREAVQTTKATQSMLASLGERASDETEKLAKEAGLSAEDEDLSDLSEDLAAIIGRNRRLYAEYIGGNPRAAVREAFEVQMKRYGTVHDRRKAAETQRKKEPLDRLPRSLGTGGQGEGEGGTSAPQNLKEADALARKLLEGFK